MWVDISGLTNWECVAEFSVGGLEWVGFSQEQPELFLCISSQKTTIYDCENGTIKECDCEYDEEAFIAVCNLLPGEFINISGQYGGQPIITTLGKEVVKIQTSPDNITTVYFNDGIGNENVIYMDYGFYTCGFNCMGNYFAFASDAGITILRKIQIPVYLTKE